MVEDRLADVPMSALEIVQMALERARSPGLSRALS
jgi:hypothetical protein